MRLNKRTWWSLFVLMLGLLIAVPGDAFAQRRGGGSRRSSPSRSRSTSKPRAAKSKARPKAAAPKRGSKTGKASNKNKWGSSKKKAGASKPKKKATKADQKAYDRAKAKGTVFKDRKSASADFKKKNAAKYTSTYASQPASRPGHIPASYASGGTTYNISYNQGYGGYGYMGVGGSWIMYNAMGDVAMASYYNRQMTSAGYHYGPRPVVGMGGGMIVLMVFAGVVVVGAIGGMVMGRSRSRSKA